MRILTTLLCLSIALTGCFGGKPFQPPPPIYTTWIKNGVSQEEVKHAMRDCGYIDLYGYGGDRSATIEDRVIREKCMFAHGYRHKSGFQGICSLSNTENIAACHNDPVLPKK